MISYDDVGDFNARIGLELRKESPVRKNFIGDSQENPFEIA